MTLVAVLVLVSLVLSRETLRRAVPFESLLVFLSVAAVTIGLFQLERLA